MLLVLLEVWFGRVSGVVKEHPKGPGEIEQAVCKVVGVRWVVKTWVAEK